MGGFAEKMEDFTVFRILNPDVRMMPPEPRRPQILSCSIRRSVESACQES